MFIAASLIKLHEFIVFPDPSNNHLLIFIRLLQSQVQRSGSELKLLGVLHRVRIFQRYQIQVIPQSVMKTREEVNVSTFLGLP